MNQLHRITKVSAQRRINRYQPLKGTPLSIQIAHSRHELALAGRTFTGDTVDVSAHGIQLRVNHPVAMASELDLWITMGTPAEKFFLHSIVKWSMPSSQPSVHIIGIQLLEKPNTDFTYWVNQLKQHFNLSLPDQAQTDQT